MSWNIVTNDLTATAGDSYFCSGNSTINVTLPASASLGDFFTVYAATSSGWAIVQSVGQQSRCSQFFSTVGSTGGVSSSGACDAVTLTYCSFNGIWEATSYQGNINVY